MSISLAKLVAAAMEQIAPLALADTTWDNVGLLVENPLPSAANRIMLTIDLTEAVLKECIEENVSVIVAYHPPIFHAFKRLCLDDLKASIILRVVSHGMSIFSPHTALDACKGGINDWLCSIIGAGISCPITPCSPLGPKARLSEAERLALPTGMGRVHKLQQPLSLQQVVQNVKAGLGLANVRVALPSGMSPDSSVSTVAVCAGSGGSVFKALKQNVDLWLTGELSHHEVLAANGSGTIVVLCEHTNTERGFLKALKPLLAARLPQTEILESKCDADPLKVW